MKKIAKLSFGISSFLFVFSMLILPFASVLAQAGVEPGQPEETMERMTNTGLIQDMDLPEFIARIISWVVGIIGVILIALFVYGGVVYATSVGNEERIEIGKKIMLYAIIGIVIIAIAFAISRYVIQALFSAT